MEPHESRRAGLDFSEVDERDKEVRKIECFRSGFCDVATALGSSGTAALMTLPLPDLSVLARRDPEFEARHDHQGRIRRSLVHPQIQSGLKAVPVPSTSCRIPSIPLFRQKFP